MPKPINNFMPADLEFQMFVLDEHADKLIDQGKDVLKLTIGVPELPTPQGVLDRIVDVLSDPDFVRRVYPEGLPELREAIASYYRNTRQADISKDDIIVSTGTSPIFRNLFQLVSGEGREILLPRPYYALYVYCATLANSTIKFYDVDPKTMRVDLDSFRANFSPERTSLVVVNSPGNPLGNIVNPSELRQIYEIVDRQAYILNDEIYGNCLFYEDFKSPLEILPEYNDITIVTNSFSKGFRMYTKRVGFAILPQELQVNLRVMQQHTLLCTDPCYQYGMIAALDDEESPAELAGIYKTRAEYTTEQLLETGCEPIAAEGGFYAVLRCADWNKSHGFDSSKELAHDILNKAHVAVVPGTDFGIPQDLRLAFCNSRYDEGIDRLKRYFCSEL